MTAERPTDGSTGPSRPDHPAGGRLAGRLVGIGVTGSIAAYKSVELVRLLRAEGADVVVVVTPTATRFVAPLTLAALSGHPVEGDVLALQADGRIGHIVIADTVDAMVVAPATAHWLGAMANGLAADSLTATCLATAAPVVVAPAMDGEMYAHPATQANVRRLRDEFGYRIAARSPPARWAWAAWRTSRRSWTRSWRSSGTGPSGLPTRPSVRRASRAVRGPATSRAVTWSSSRTCDGAPSGRPGSFASS